MQQCNTQTAMAEAIYPVSTGWLVQGRTWFSLGKHLEPPKPGRYSEKSVEKLRIMPSAIAVHLRLYTWDNMDLDLSFQVPLMEYRLYHKVPSVSTFSLGISTTRVLTRYNQTYCRNCLKFTMK